MSRFQNFDAPAAAAPTAERLAALRERMRQENIDAVLIPHADEHQSEYLPECAERLAYISGFTGSAGAAIILSDAGVLFVDGRYTLQAKAQVDASHFTIESLVTNPPQKWVETCPTPLRLGIDPRLHTIAETERLEKALSKQGGSLVFLADNPIDAIWTDQPSPPLGQTTIHPKDYAGRLASEKLAALQKTLTGENLDATVLTDPASIAWLLNIRGSDVPHTPLTLAFLIVRAEGEPVLFVDRRKLDRASHAYLHQMVTIEEPGSLVEQLHALGAEQARIGLDRSLASRAVHDAVTSAGGSAVPFDDPVRLPRAIKNDVEMAGSRAAHRRDGAAMAMFLAWLSAQEPGTISEIAAAERLEQCRDDAARADNTELRDISFDTISGSGPNGAIVHYRVTEATNRTLGHGELYLVDSGGQYVDGTTDITRTIAIGNPTDAMKRHATAVLKGMIALSRARFPEETWGSELDPVARAPLWAAGLDYAHGTGHGVGSFLAVHEGPQRIARTGKTALQAGMIVSNEPGYYRTGEYGIRMENLILVEPASEIEKGGAKMHGFETLTLCPFDRNLIDSNILSSDEAAWLDAYHARVLKEIGPMVPEDVRNWLQQACKPL